MVDEDSITVQLTPIGNHHAWVDKIEDNKVYIGGGAAFYFIQAERKDIDKLQTEVELTENDMGLTIGLKIITENLTLHFDSGNPLGWNNTDGEWHNFTQTQLRARNTNNITYNVGEDALFFK